MTSSATTYPWLARSLRPPGWGKHLVRRRQDGKSIAIEDAIAQMERQFGAYRKAWKFGGGEDRRFFVFWVKPQETNALG